MMRRTGQLSIYTFCTSLMIFFVPVYVYADDIVSVNQVGYLPGEMKYVITNIPADSFRVINASSGESVFSEAINPTVSNDEATGMNLYEGDFTALDIPGTYYVRLSNSSVSATFGIDSAVYGTVLDISLKSFYLSRCGLKLESQFAGEYEHDRCHFEHDGRFHPSSGISGFKFVDGGWHDAGDFGKYVVNAGITVGTLLMAYEFHPDRFNSDDSNIPESGNSVPDILDEVRYELEWLLKMQDEDGGVYHKLTRETFSGFIMPEDDDETRFIYQVSSTATADFAAMMAKAARIYAAYDQDFADSCLAVAERAWDWLQGHPTIVPPGGFSNPEGTNTGTYGDSNDSDERVWAAAELFVTTGEAVYDNYYTAAVLSSGGFTSKPGWPNVASMGHLTYLVKGTSAGGNAGTITALEESLVSLCNSLVTRAQSDGFHVAIELTDYHWGSNSDVLNNAILLIEAFERTGEADYYNTALSQFHYILGLNAHDLSFVTGSSETSVMNPHNRPSAADGIDAPVPGLLAGGPNRYLSDPVLRAIFTSNTPPALCYIDDVGSYASNENAINWNTTLVYVSGWFASSVGSGVRGDSGGILPGGINLYQNYPNPFNGTTTIRFDIEVSTAVNLVIYNILGEQIYGTSWSVLEAGDKILEWDGRGMDGKSVGSGVYFVRIEAGGYSEAKKMVYLR